MNLNQPAIFRYVRFREGNQFESRLVVEPIIIPCRISFYLSCFEGLVVFFFATKSMEICGKRNMEMNRSPFSVRTSSNDACSSQLSMSLYLRFMNFTILKEKRNPIKRRYATKLGIANKTPCNPDLLTAIRKRNIIFLPLLTTKQQSTLKPSQLVSIDHACRTPPPKKKKKLKKPLEPAQSYIKIHLPPMCVKRPLVLSWTDKFCVWQSEKNHPSNGMKSVSTVGGLTPPKLTICPWKMMVGKQSFQNSCRFSGGAVHLTGSKHTNKVKLASNHQAIEKESPLYRRSSSDRILWRWITNLNCLQPNPQSS